MFDIDLRSLEINDSTENIIYKAILTNEDNKTINLIFILSDRYSIFSPKIRDYVLDIQEPIGPSDHRRAVLFNTENFLRNLLREKTQEFQEYFKKHDFKIQKFAIFFSSDETSMGAIMEWYFKVYSLADVKEYQPIPFGLHDDINLTEQMERMYSASE